MGRIVLGMGTSHSPQLSTPPELWAALGERDTHNPALLDNSGKRRSFEELLEMAPPTMRGQVTPEKFQQRHEACQKGIARLSQAVADASLDALVIIGDDQEEMFLDDNMPMMTVYWGDSFTNGQQIPPDAPPARRAAAWGWGEPDGERSYPVASDLGLHISEHLREQEFDIAQSRRMTPHRRQNNIFMNQERPRGNFPGPWDELQDVRENTAA